MKHGSIKAVCLVVLACMTVLSAYGDETTVDLTSVVLERFNGDTVHEWNDGRHARSFEFSWGMSASRFATKSKDDDGNESNFPLSTYVDAWPIALFGYNRDGKDIKSFGIHGRFDRRGYNWIDLYPVNEDQPFEIPIPGRARYLDMWVWGSNLNYYIEAYVRDHLGIVHRIHVGNLNYVGWRNLRANIPINIPQSKRILPALASLKFVKFRIWTQPEEYVSNFYIYFNQFKVLTATFESLYDGDELSDPDRIPELWGNTN
jgi:hypothetical protein